MADCSRHLLENEPEIGGRIYGMAELRSRLCRKYINYVIVSSVKIGTIFHSKFIPA